METNGESYGGYEDGYDEGGDQGDYDARVMSHLADLLEAENAQADYGEPEPVPQVDAHQAAAMLEQEAILGELVGRYPRLDEIDTAQRLMSEVRAQAERIGLPEAAGDARFIAHVADQLGANRLASPQEQIANAGREHGRGAGVLDFRT